MKVIQILLLCINLVFNAASLAQVYLARRQRMPVSLGKLLACIAILFLIIGLVLPWSAFPINLGESQKLTDSLEETNAVVLLAVIVPAAWIVYRKRSHEGRFFSIVLSLLGFITFMLVLLSFTFDEEKASFVSANEAYISSLIKPSIGYYLSLIGSALLFISGFLGRSWKRPVIQVRAQHDV